MIGDRSSGDHVKRLLVHSTCEVMHIHIYPDCNELICRDMLKIKCKATWLLTLFTEREWFLWNLPSISQFSFWQINENISKSHTNKPSTIFTCLECPTHKVLINNGMLQYILVYKSSVGAQYTRCTHDSGCLWYTSCYRSDDISPHIVNISHPDLGEMRSKVAHAMLPQSKNQNLAPSCILNSDWLHACTLLWCG